MYKKVGLIRCDRGFYSDGFLSELERKKLNYVIEVKFNPTIKMEVLGLRKWISIKDGIELCEFTYQSPDWKKTLRLVAVRKNISKLK